MIKMVEVIFIIAGIAFLGYRSLCSYYLAEENKKLKNKIKKLLKQRSKL